MGDKGIDADAKTYTAAIDACAKDGQWQRALSVLDDMLDKNIAANVITYSAVMNACYSQRIDLACVKLYAYASRKGFLATDCQSQGLK